ncbi:MAG TPA: hypothetical protein VFM82_09455, partial [Flavobacteriaceae bacterium]|nr:hypothetical protein [Flavobacteriaceae bacterium]
MGVKIIKRIYNEDYSDTATDWLLGNVGDWQKVLIEVEAGVEFLANQQSPLQIDYVNNAIVLAGGQNWGQLGFDSGMVVTLRYKKSIDSNNDGTFDQVQTISNDYTINNIYENVMEIEEDLEVDGFENIPTNFGTQKISEVILFANVDIEGCKLRYGHVPNNDQSENLASVIDGTTTEFILPQLNALTAGNWAYMEPVGKQSGMSVLRAKIRSLAGSQDNIALNMQGGFWNEVESIGIQRTLTTEYMHIRNTGLIPIIIFPSGLRIGTVEQNLVPTANSSGNIQNGNSSTAFWFNQPVAEQRQFFMNVNVRITKLENIVPTDLFKLVLLKYTNGEDMDFVEKTTIQSWANLQTLINEPLNFNGIVDVDMNATDSLVLAWEYEQDPENGINGTGYTNIVRYKIGEVFVQVSNPNQEFSIGANRIYQIEVEYMLSSFFENLTNLQNLEMPSYLTGDGSLMDNFLIKFFPEWNNPNVIIQNDPKETRRFGNTGWFNENFNQLNNDFAIESIQYFDEDDNPIEAIDYTKYTKIKTVVSGIPNLGSGKYGFGFAWVPKNPDDYKNKETPFHKNVYSHSDIYGLGPNPGSSGYGINGAAIQFSNVELSEEDGKLVIELRTHPINNFSTVFENKNEDDRNYVLWVSVADGELPRQFSDRVSLIVDVNNMVKSIPPAGPYENITNKFIEHPFEADVQGVEVYKGISQDDILCRLPFTVKKDGTVFQKMTFGVEAFHPEKPSFELERFEVDLSQFPTANGVQQFDFDSIRGFKLENGNNKNWVKIHRKPELDTNIANGYTAFYA